MKKLDEILKQTNGIHIQIQYDKNIHCSYNSKSKIFGVFSNKGYQLIIHNNEKLNWFNLYDNINSSNEFMLFAIYWYNSLS